MCNFVKQNKMENNIKYQFKTNIKCGGCISKVGPVLDEKVGIVEWNVDTTNPDKILTVQANGISENEIITTVQNAGYKIEKI